MVGKVTDTKWFEDMELDPERFYLFRGKPKPSTHDLPRRTGLIALKVGMMTGFNEYGQIRPLTVLKVEDCFVVQTKVKAKDGVNAVQVGAGPVKAKRVKKPQLGHFSSVGVPPRRHLAEFQVTEEGLLPPGTELTARHFVPGQFVDIQGTTIGKGFQGGMKRWGFKGQPASHGVSLAHRSVGSIGQCQDPGRVWKGKKMPGRMGNKTKTVQNMVVFKVDPARNLIFVEGSVPGHKGNVVRIKDAIKKPLKLYNGAESNLPFPTFVPPEGETEEDLQVMMQPKPKSNVLDELSP